jgi:hypothetical protein
MAEANHLAPLLAARLDRRRVLHWVEQFASALEMPEILDDLKRVLERNQEPESPE